MGLLPAPHTGLLDRGAVVIAESRRLRDACAAGRRKSLLLERRTRDFLLAHPSFATSLIRGASDLVDADRNGPREVWVHRPTGDRWVVVTDRTGSPISAVGPFPATQWDPLLRDHVMLDGHYSLAWIREYIDEFVRDDGRQP